MTISPGIPRQILTVSKLTQKIKLLLEKNYSMVWISGEISNLRIASSGHAYFTLKDNKAQIAGVMFRGQIRVLKFTLEDGISIIGLGRISVYEPRGTYQIILEYVEPHGLGALQMAFEQLKQKLADEGLFDEAHKVSLPLLPQNICVITSPIGAVIQDILHVAQRRFTNMQLMIIPVRVQGYGAENEIARALTLVNQQTEADVVILARGGGSIEDLAPFNSEIVARAIHASAIPVVSAVGHETDYTITDFVADLRAPTPSAAAELIVPVKSELSGYHKDLRNRMQNALLRIIKHYRINIDQLQRQIVHPQQKIQTLQMRCDELQDRLLRSFQMYFKRRQLLFRGIEEKIFHIKLDNYFIKYRLKIEFIISKLSQLLKIYLNTHREKLNSLNSTLHALSPTAVLKRGYSISRTLPHKQIITDAGTVCKGQQLEIRLAKGWLQAEVTQSNNPN